MMIYFLSAIMTMITALIITQFLVGRGVDPECCIELSHSASLRNRRVECMHMEFSFLRRVQVRWDE
jgi:hypothetical protein